MSSTGTVGVGSSSVASLSASRPDSITNNSTGGRRAATTNKGTKDAPSSTYYTTQKAGQTTSCSSANKKGSALSSSEPNTGKRAGAQSAHCVNAHGDRGTERTPKTPQTANIFRRKWGGASSTKSQHTHKSQSSQRSAAGHPSVNA